jgi:hypothetical protein
MLYLGLQKEKAKAIRTLRDATPWQGMLHSRINQPWNGAPPDILIQGVLSPISPIAATTPVRYSVHAMDRILSSFHHPSNYICTTMEPEKEK